MKKVLAAICASAFLAFPMATSAATATAPIVVTAQVQTSCGITAPNIPFGVYNPGSGNTVTATMTITCSAGTSGGTVTISGTAGTRQMTDGAGNFLNYEVYSDTAMATPWDVGTPLAFTGATATFNVDGKLPAAQSVPAGSYSDTLTATVNY